MAARITRYHTEEIRAKIQSCLLIKMLEDHALLGKEAKKSQISAAIALLRKTIPDLQSIEGSLEHRHRKHEDALKDLE
jgi:hypothetical protein